MTQDADRQRRARRRNLLAGVVAGLIIASVAVATAKTTFKKMVAGKAATAADVNQAHQDLAGAIDKLAAKVAKAEGAAECPPGYARDTKASGIPAAPHRGGSATWGAASGVFTISLVDSPTKWWAFLGVRCCR